MYIETSTFNSRYSHLPVVRHLPIVEHLSKTRSYNTEIIFYSFLEYFRIKISFSKKKKGNGSQIRFLDIHYWKVIFSIPISEIETTAAIFSIPISGIEKTVAMFSIPVSGIKKNSEIEKTVTDQLSLHNNCCWFFTRGVQQLGDAKKIEKKKILNYCYKMWRSETK